MMAKILTMTTNPRNWLTSRAARVLGLAAFVLAAGATSVSAETLMMPKRDARTGSPVVVWGVTAQASTAACMIDFGDATAPAVCNGADRSYIATTHNYASPGIYTVTLTVNAETATTTVTAFDPAGLPGGVAGDANRSLGINMAIEDGLRYLWTTQSSRAANFPLGTTTNWGNSFSASDAALITLSFENHGYKLANDGSAPTGLYEKYIVRRGLNYVIGSLTTVTLASQPSGFAGQPVRDPCVGVGIEASPCVGLRNTLNDTFHESYTTGVAILPLAASGALSRVNTEVAGYSNGRTYGEILQRAANALAWGQIDVNNASRGGWFYNFNSSSSDGSTIGWDLLAMLDAAAAGAVVPAWVNTEFAFALAGGLNTDGSLDYQANGNPASNSNVGPAKNGIGLQGLYFIGELAGPRVAAVTANVNSWWSGGPGIGGNSWGGCSNLNKGCAYTMFNNFKGLKLHGITTLPGVTRPAGPGAQPAGDWHEDYKDWLVTNQSVPSTVGGGSWGPAMGFSCCYSGDPIETAIGELILSAVALVLPDADKFGAFGLTPATNTAIEGGSHTVTAHAESTGGTPVPGATVNFTILTGPNAGMTGTDTTDTNGEATFTYTDGGPLGTTGTDTIRASIGALNSNIVEMIWIPLNRPPVATDNSYPATEDNPVVGNAVTDAVADSDPDAGDTLTATLLTGVANGALTFNGDGSFTYLPNANYCGPDSFTYKVNDGTVDSNIATVTINVACVNDPPVANDNAHSMLEDGPPVSGTATASDIDGIALTYAQSSPASNGSVVFNADGTYTYTPNANFNGTDSFEFTVSDGAGGSDVGLVTITIISVNDIPVCTAAAPSVSMIWPPNHKLVNVTIGGVTDVEGAITINVTSIYQDEPTNTQGDGNTPIDGYGVGTSTAQVRAERAGTPKLPGNGRMYHISFEGIDSDGDKCSGVVRVGVPHDQGQGRVVIDGGPLYSSTGS